MEMKKQTMPIIMVSRKLAEEKKFFSIHIFHMSHFECDGFCYMMKGVIVFR